MAAPNAACENASDDGFAANVLPVTLYVTATVCWSPLGSSVTCREPVYVPAGMELLTVTVPSDGVVPERGLIRNQLSVAITATVKDSAAFCASLMVRY